MLRHMWSSTAGVDHWLWALPDAAVKVGGGTLPSCASWEMIARQASMAMGLPGMPQEATSCRTDAALLIHTAHHASSTAERMLTSC